MDQQQQQSQQPQPIEPRVFSQALGEISGLIFACFLWVPPPEKRREVLERIRDITTTALRDG